MSLGDINLPKIIVRKHHSTRQWCPVVFEGWTSGYYEGWSWSTIGASMVFPWCSGVSSGVEGWTSRLLWRVVLEYHWGLNGVSMVLWVSSGVEGWTSRVLWRVVLEYHWGLNGVSMVLWGVLWTGVEGWTSRVLWRVVLEYHWSDPWSASSVFWQGPRWCFSGALGCYVVFEGWTFRVLKGGHGVPEGPQWCFSGALGCFM
jgi:hypothetical protein